MKTNNQLLKNFLEENKLNPIYIYEDLDLENKKSLIRKETNNLSGIYLIFNKITGDYYIGSASTNKFFTRFSNHLLYFKGSKILKLAVKEYKLKNFVFIILELFPEIVNKYNNKKLLDIEDFYLKSLLPNYNILTEAGSEFGYKHTELSRLKIKSTFSLEDKNLITSLNKYNTFSLKRLIKAKGKINHSPLIKEAFLDIKKNEEGIILYNLNDTIFGEYSSITEAAKDINCSPKTINRALKTEKKILKKRFIVKFKNLNV